MSGDIPPRLEAPVAKSGGEGWTCQVYSGGEVYLLAADEQPTAATLDAFTVKDRHIPRDTPLKAGQRLLCPTLFGYGIGVVGADGHVTSASGQTLYMVSQAEVGDDRACWVCHGSGNLAGIRKLTLDR